MLNEWWTGINGLEKAFWFIALPFTAVLLVQLIMTFTGMGDNQGGDDGFDDAQDDSGDGAFRLFTVRNFIILFSVFGWSGVTFASIGINNILTVILSIVLGFIVMLIVAALFYFSNKLTENGTMNINLAMGMTGEVYLPIPGKKTGTGKIHIAFQGSLKELDAMTEGEAIPRGNMVQVIDVIGDHIVLVEAK